MSKDVRGRIPRSVMSEHDKGLKRWMDALEVLIAVIDPTRSGGVNAKVIDDLAHRYCVRCRALDNAGDRLGACLLEGDDLRPRCGIRLIEYWQAVETLAWGVAAELDAPTFSPETIDLLRSFFVKSRSAFPDFVVDAEGYGVADYQSDTLLGRILIALLTIVATHSGDLLRVNVGAFRTVELRHLADLARKRHREMGRDRLGRLAQSRSIHGVAKSEHHSRNTVRRAASAQATRRKGGGPEVDNIGPGVDSVNN